MRWCARSADFSSASGNEDPGHYTCPEIIDNNWHQWRITRFVPLLVACSARRATVRGLLPPCISDSGSNYRFSFAFHDAMHSHDPASSPASTSSIFPSVRDPEQPFLNCAIGPVPKHCFSGLLARVN